MSVFTFIFLLKHTLCVPGGTLLNAIGGALFGVYVAIPLCLVLTVLGSIGAYTVSHTCGAPLLIKWKMESRLLPLKRRVDAAASKGSLFRLLISLRMLPLFPQWLVNLGGPHIGIPLHLFIPTTAIGLIPYVAATVGSGATLAEVLDGADISALLPPQTVLLLCLFAGMVGVGPTIAGRLGLCGMESGAAEITGSAATRRDAPTGGRVSQYRGQTVWWAGERNAAV